MMTKGDRPLLSLQQDVLTDTDRTRLRTDSLMLAAGSERRQPMQLTKQQRTAIFQALLSEARQKTAKGLDLPGHRPHSRARQAHPACRIQAGGHPHTGASRVPLAGCARWQAAALLERNQPYGQ